MFEFIHGLCPHFSKTSGVSTILDNFHKQDGELIYQTHAFINTLQYSKNIHFDTNKFLQDVKTGSPNLIFLSTQSTALNQDIQYLNMSPVPGCTVLCVS